ncbi:hypothetical protein LTR64_001774 [Lithohypha guttulata]|uniref:uncharacterized protein n=1 Tax=Lithohypha guttulata TaxID=1690604 RepID=UPI002DDF732F|nr:hypothetical protein LTR51_003968 [Lithohypha guttulata]
MSYDNVGSERSKPRFMQATQASRASKATTPSPLQTRPGVTPLPSSLSRGQHLFQRASQRLTSFSTSKSKPSRLPIVSPGSSRNTRAPSLVLSSPTQRYSHLPEPIKKPSLESPTEKPLPSLPVATFVPRSPVHRRSLIDAAEKPLRKAVSPGIEQDWPTLLPANLTEIPEPQGIGKSAETPTMIKPSLSESLYEGMRNLKVNDDASGQLRSIRTESNNKINAQNFTPKIFHNSSEALKNHPVEDTKFLDPRPAPGTPRVDKQDRSSTGSSINRRSSHQGLNILKARRKFKSSGQNSQPPSFIPQPLSTTIVQEMEDTSPSNNDVSNNKTELTESRMSRKRGVSATGSPYSNYVKNSSKVVQLKRACSRISDMKEQVNSNDDDKHTDDTKDMATIPDTSVACTLPSERQSSLPLPTRPVVKTSTVDAKTILSTWMRANACETPEQSLKSGSSSTTIRNGLASVTKVSSETKASTLPSISSRKSSMKENVSPNHPGDDEDLSPIRTFKFPANTSEVDDNSSQMTRITSASSLSKAGTIYAQDERGRYRLKPLSLADPKHGPRVRIDDSADHLLLSDEQLAHVEAKRAAYMHKIEWAKPRDGHKENEVFPELESLKGTNTNTQANEGSNPGPALDQQLQSKSSCHSLGKGLKLAPPVAENIGILSHSPDGWPLLTSKIAPFAETDASAPASIPPNVIRMSASEAKLESTPGTPLRQHGNNNQTSPSSAYTLRTALNKLPNEAEPATTSLKPKLQKSLPELARPLFPLRTSSKSDSPSALSPLHGGVRRRTSGRLQPFVNQRATFRRVTNKSQDDEYTHAHPAVTSAESDTLASPAQHMQSYHASTRHMNAHQDIDSDLPSSPLAVPGTVHSNKPKMMSKFGGLFHKTSREGDLHRSGSIKATHNHKPNIPSPLGETLSDFSANISRGGNITLFTGLDNIAASKTQNGLLTTMHGTASNDDSTSKTSHSASAIYHGMVKETSSPPSVKRKFPRLTGHKHSATISSAASLKPRDMSPQFMTSALEPPEIREATTLAFSLLDRARDIRYGTGASSTPSPTNTDEDGETVNDGAGVSQADYVELAKVIVSIVAMAREAEKAKEEAKSAAARAEIESVKTRRNVAELCVRVNNLISGGGQGRGGDEEDEDESEGVRDWML